MDSYEKKSYGSEPEYGMDSYDKKPSYGSEPEYGMDSYEKKSYGSEPEYGTQYQSYGKDNREKSKDSVSIKKVKCNNINLNLNGLNITAAGGSGTNGAGTDDSAVGAASLSGNGDSNGFGDRNHKKLVDKKDGFVFVCINNNNNNFNGSAPTPPIPVETCEDCFIESLGAETVQTLVTFLGTLPPTAANNLEEYCALIQGQILAGLPVDTIVQNIQNDLEDAGLFIDDSHVVDLVECLTALFENGTENGTI
jgi:hypothetical protein